MADIRFGRIRDIGGLPDLVCELAGKEGLEFVFSELELPLTILENPDAAVPMRDLVLLYERAARVTGERSFGLTVSNGLVAEDYGLVCLYPSQAPDLMTALMRFQIALPYHEQGSSAHIEIKGNELRVSYHNAYQNLVGWRHAGDFTLFGLMGLIRSYLGEDCQGAMPESW